MEFLPPVFFKASDVPSFKTLKEYEVCKSVFEVIDKESVVGCQRIRGLWRIYINNTEDRIKLLANRITLRNQTIGLYKDNPYRAGLESPDQEVVRISIINLPLSKGNSGIEKFLIENEIEKTSDIQFGKIRDPETKELTNIYSGSRIVYVKPFSKNLLRNAHINGSSVNIYYDGQVLPQRPKLCTNCYAEDHYKSQCTKQKVCIKCKQVDHDISDTNCDAETVKPHTNVTPFQGSSDILSNFYPCTINIHGINAKSSEHAYQYVKAIRRGKLDVAKRIESAPTAFLAKKTANELPFSETWAEEKLDVMTQIIEEKAKQVPEFKTELLETKSNSIVEAVTGNLFWSCGLNKHDTLNTKKRFWPGENHMGQLLTELRAQLKNNQNGAKKK